MALRHGLPIEGTRAAEHRREHSACLASLRKVSQGERILGLEQKKARVSLMFRPSERLHGGSGQLSSDHGGLCTLKATGYPEEVRLQQKRAQLLPGAPPCPTLSLLTGTEKTARSLEAATRQTHHCLHACKGNNRLLHSGASTEIFYMLSPLQRKPPRPTQPDPPASKRPTAPAPA